VAVVSLVHDPVRDDQWFREQDYDSADDIRELREIADLRDLQFISSTLQRTLLSIARVLLLRRHFAVPARVGQIR
jgi:hypothetical protein